MEEGDVLPGGAGTVVRVDQPVLNNLGHVAFSFRSTDGVTNFEGLALWTDAGIEVRELEGSSIGSAGESWNDFSDDQLNINDSDEIMFVGTLDTGPLNAGVVGAVGLSRPGQAPSTVAYARQPLPDGNGEFSRFGIEIARMNQAGEVAVLSYLDNTTPPRSPLQALLLWSDGVLEFVHEPVFIDSDNSRGQPGDFAVTDSGELAFSFTQEVAGVGSQPLVLATPAGAETVLLASDPAPGVPGSVIGSLLGSGGKLRVNNAGDIIIHSALGGQPASSNSGLWFYDRSIDTLSLVAQEGDAVGSTTVGDVQSVSGTKAFNDHGTIAFGSSFEGGMFYYNGSSISIIAEIGQAAPRGDGTLPLSGAPGGATRSRATSGTTGWP